MNNTLDSKSLLEVWEWKQRLADLVEAAENKEQVYENLSKNTIRRLGLKTVHRPSSSNVKVA